MTSEILPYVEIWIFSTYFGGSLFKVGRYFSRVPVEDNVNAGLVVYRYVFQPLKKFKIFVTGGIKYAQAYNILAGIPLGMGTAVVQWLRCCATNRKVVDSISGGVIGIFH